MVHTQAHKVVTMSLGGSPSQILDTAVNALVGLGVPVSVLLVGCYFFLHTLCTQNNKLTEPQ